MNSRLPVTKSRPCGDQVTLEPQHLRPHAQELARKGITENSAVSTLVGSPVREEACWVLREQTIPLIFSRETSQCEWLLGHTLPDICLEGLVPQNGGWRALPGRGEMGNISGWVSQNAKPRM